VCLLGVLVIKPADTNKIRDIDKAKWFRIIDRAAAEAVLLGSEPERPRFLVRQGLVMLSCDEVTDSWPSANFYYCECYACSRTEDAYHAFTISYIPSVSDANPTHCKIMIKKRVVRFL